MRDGRWVPTSTSGPLWFAYGAAALATSGTQGIAPALPSVQDHFGLSQSEIGLVTTLFLVPAVLLPLPFSWLANRYGVQRVFRTSLAAFGVAGAVVALSAHSLAFFLLIRVAQGAAFAAIVPLSIAVISDTLEGEQQVDAQGYRNAAMKIASTVLPIVSGLLVAFAWYLPFALPVLALPLAVIGWRSLSPNLRGTSAAEISVPEQEGPRGYVRLDGFWNSRSIVLQGVSFSRLFFEFAFITYLPVLLASTYGLGPTFAGIVLGAMSFSGALAAAVVGRLLRRWPARLVLGLSAVVMGMALVATGTASDWSVILLAGVAFGAADGAYGAIANVFIAAAAPKASRASYIAASGTIKNLGKVAAPAAIAIGVLFLPLTLLYVILGLAAVLVAAAAIPLSGFSLGMTAKSGN